MSAAGRKFDAEVLIADDEQISREILQVYLESLGCRVQAVTNAIDALKAYEEGLEWIELVILDACMPGPSPQFVFDRIHALKPSAPVLFCSGVSPDDPELRFIYERGLRLLPKPFNRTALALAIAEVLNQAQAPVAKPVASGLDEA